MAGPQLEPLRSPRETRCDRLEEQGHDEEPFCGPFPPPAAEVAAGALTLDNDADAPHGEASGQERGEEQPEADVFIVVTR
ncbi:hypothetical protein [Streptomyces sp. NRRL B-24572]|uniref:hypothetical protein n=1 Tax=Streptomyces sp. NRRL B-24572 TaxID=1962156 RepID=UPI00117C1F83|nr:hypothetical protein [Streptomyces sp. NRRL B-24572]